MITYKIFKVQEAKHIGRCGNTDKKQWEDWKPKWLYSQSSQEINLSLLLYLLSLLS